MRTFFTKLVAFFKKRGLILLSGFFLMLLVISILISIKLNLDIKELKNQTRNQQNEISLLSSKEESYNEAINVMQLELSALNESEEDYLTNYNNLLQELEEERLLLGRRSVTESRDIVSYLDEELFEKIVYLTFDDGPSMRTERILNKLDEHKIKATFFVNYNVYSDEHNLYNEIVDRGHAIGNHTYDHVFATNNWSEFYESLFKMEDYIFEKTGVWTNLIRFPGGSNYRWKYSSENSKKAVELENMGYIFFDWNVSNYDSSSDITFNDSEEMAKYVINQSIGREKIILLMHDRSQKYMTVDSLDMIIDYYKKEGYVFLPLTDSSIKMQFFSMDE